MAKKFQNLFYLITFITVIFIVYFLYTVLPNTKKYSEEVVEKFLHVINNKLVNINANNKFIYSFVKNSAIPFSLKDVKSKIENKKNNKMNVVLKEDEVLNKIISFFKFYDIKTKIANQNSNSNDESISSDKDKIFRDIDINQINLSKIKVFRHVNLWLLCKIDDYSDIISYEQNINKYNQIKSKLKAMMLKEIGFLKDYKVIFKTLYHSNKIEEIHFYDDLKYHNSNYALEELNDSKALNLVLNFDLDNYDIDDIDNIDNIDKMNEKHKLNEKSKFDSSDILDSKNYDKHNELSLKENKFDRVNLNHHLIPIPVHLNSKNLEDARTYSIYNPDLKKYIYRIENPNQFMMKENEISLNKILYFDYFVNFGESSQSFDLNILKYIGEEELIQFYYFRYLLLGAQNISILNVSLIIIRTSFHIMNLLKTLIL